MAPRNGMADFEIFERTPRKKNHKICNEFDNLAHFFLVLKFLQLEKKAHDHGIALDGAILENLNVFLLVPHLRGNQHPCFKGMSKFSGEYSNRF